MRVPHLLLPLAGVCLALISVSCGDSRFKPVYPVSGHVFYEGKPAAGAGVKFLAVGGKEDPWTRPSAEVGEDGSFTLSTYKAGDGAPAGKYEIVIIWLPPGYHGPVEQGNRLPARYADRTTSGLTVEVKAGKNTLEPFQLTP